MNRTNSLESYHYYDEGIFTKEINHIFKEEWLWVGRSEQLKNPGDFVTTDVVHFPIILIRNKDHQLKAFHNVCRHRASKVELRQSGNCNQLVCPYHGWRYSLEGSLSNPAKFHGAESFNHNNYSLFAIKIQEKYGLVFINLSENPKPLEKWLGPFNEVVGSQYKNDFLFHNELKFDVHANWKTYVDNYQEGYHIPSVHSQLNKDVLWEEYQLINNDNCSIHSVPERAGSNQPGSFGWHFPNFIFNIYGRGIVYQRIEPLKPKWCRVVYNLFRPCNISYDDFENNEGKYQLEVSLEDQELVPEIQQNLQAGVYTSGPLSKKYETGVAYFHDLIINKLNMEQ
jgi:choline monooxygenase